MPRVYAGLRLLSTEIRGLQAAVYVLAGCALASSLLALVRDRLFAHTFGAGVELDLYYAAFRIPDLLFVATSALVSAYVLIPELTRRSHLDRVAYIDTIVTGFSFLSIVVASVLAWCAPTMLSFLFPSFSKAGLLPVVTSLTRIMLMQPVLLGCSNIFASITQSRRRYALYAISPLLYNVGIIVGLLYIYPLCGITGLAWGVVLGALLHAGIQIPSIISDGFFHRIPRMHDARTFFTTIATSVPRALTLSMSQLAFIGLTALAATLAPGSIAIFMFAFNLQAVPLAIIGASYSVAAFPVLSKSIASGNHEVFIDHIARAARYILFWSLPASALIMVLRAHIVRTILGSGSFDWTDTRLTAACLGILSLSLAAQSILLLLVRGYYAAGRTLAPLIIASITTIATLILASVSIALLHNEHVLGALERMVRADEGQNGMIIGLAIAYAIGSIGGTCILVIHFTQTFGDFFSKITQTLRHACIAACTAGAAAYTMLWLLGPLTTSSTLLGVVIRAGIGGVAGIGIAGVVYAILGTNEYSETVHSASSCVTRAAPAGEPYRFFRRCGTVEPHGTKNT